MYWRLWIGFVHLTWPRSTSFPCLPSGLLWPCSRTCTRWRRACPPRDSSAVPCLEGPKERTEGWERDKGNRGWASRPNRWNRQTPERAREQVEPSDPVPDLYKLTSDLSEWCVWISFGQDISVSVPVEGMLLGEPERFDRREVNESRKRDKSSTL